MPVMQQAVSDIATGVDARVSPEGRLEVLSQDEVARLRDASRTEAYDLLWRCAYAVLNSGVESDDSKALMARAQGFDIRVLQRERGIKLELTNAPAHAFVDGRMIRGIKEHLFAVLRDVVYVATEINDEERFHMEHPRGVTNAVFHILRNARLLQPQRDPDLVVCWGGHSIGRTEYQYTKETGYELGLRGLNICTGCGPGAMKGPMKGATIAHAKQRISDGRYVGITEPGIIAAESPNPIVNDLVIMPDIEKRLEAFVRTGHGFVVFPGGVGTTEEILYLLGILLHPDNREMPFPLVLTGPEESAEYFDRVDRFIRGTLGDEATERYRILIGDPAAVAQEMKAGMEAVREWRLARKDAFYFNWGLHIDGEFQVPFRPTHENMAQLRLGRDQADHRLAVDLRRAFSGIVAGNVKEAGIRAVEQHGHFEIHGDPEVMGLMDDLLQSFVDQQRMRLPGAEYKPCYRIVA
ncbi:MAG: nucleotide 5'-monophosphate nucleosidase PpnN [Halofilum sp. (in: g-proteobacteria)]|nr:nucleotide 5'-monophosphate nucleosidase PpnN [Halofilum sp. (in: g-proteobacteria)]